MVRNSKKIIIAILVAGLVGLLLYHFVFRETENTVHVTVENGLSVNKVRIQRGVILLYGF